MVHNGKLVKIYNFFIVFICMLNTCLHDYMNSQLLDSSLVVGPYVSHKIALQLLLIVMHTTYIYIASMLAIPVIDNQVNRSD